MSDSPVILFAGGGTGGHVFPLVALAEKCLQVAPQVRFFFVGTQRGLEAKVIPARGWQLETLSVEPLQGRGTMERAKGVFLAGSATVQASRMIVARKPKLIVSIGGYAAGPVTLAGAAMGVPVALLEPNRTLGLTQRLLAPLAKRIYVGFPESLEKLGKKGRFFGMPLRDGFTPTPMRVRPTDGPLRLLIVGGSQGAEHLNVTMPSVVQMLAKGVELQVVHQVGRGKLESVEKSYTSLPSSADVCVTEFIDDVPLKLAWADVVVARSGASSTAEICTIGRPSLLIPFPHAADDHQAANAFALEQAGAAFALRQQDATTQAILERLQRLLQDQVLCSSMAQAAQLRAHHLAAETIIRDLLSMAQLA